MLLANYNCCINNTLQCFKACGNNNLWCRTLFDACSPPFFLPFWGFSSFYTPLSISMLNAFMIIATPRLRLFRVFFPKLTPTSSTPCLPSTPSAVVNHNPNPVETKKEISCFGKRCRLAICCCVLFVVCLVFDFYAIYLL